MSFTSDLHLINLARQLLLAGAALLMLDGSALAEAPINTEKAPRTLIVSDSVQLAGSKISGGWREYAADGSWRRVAFVLDGNVASVTFGDGKNGSRVPGVTRYAYAGPGGKDVKDGDAKAVYSEAQVFAGASPEIRDKANQSAIVPSEVATRIRELGGDIKSLQQLADIRRISELGSAFDAARGAAADSGFFPDRPGGSPRRNGGGWKDPRGGVGHDGRAGDDIVESTDEHTDREGSHTTTIVTRHDDGSTTTVESWVGVRGSTTYSSTDKDVKGNVTGGSTEVHQTNGESTKMQYQRNPDTGEMNYHRITTSPDGTSRHYIGTTRRTAPSETPYSGRGGIDEAWMDKSLPWFMDTVYLNWKRENDLVQSVRGCRNGSSTRCGE